jgi:NCS1 family nucleobase:cation symporter-1
MVAASTDLEAINADTLGYIGSLFPAISTPFVLLLTIGCTVVGSMNLYSANQAVMTMVTSRGGSASAVLVRAVVTGAFAVAGGFVALAVSENFITSIGGLVSSVAYLLIPWSAINLVDFFLIRRGHYDIGAIVDRRGRYGLFNVKAMSVYLLGVLVEIPFIVSDYPAFVGPIARAMGGLNFAWTVGFIVCGGVYWWLERGNSLPRATDESAAGAGER